MAGVGLEVLASALFPDRLGLRLRVKNNVFDQLKDLNEESLTAFLEENLLKQ